MSNPSPVVRYGNPATFNPNTSTCNTGDVVCDDGNNLRGGYGVVLRTDPTNKVVVRLLPLVAVAVVESSPGAGVENLRVQATTPHTVAVASATYLVTAKANNDPISAVAIGPQGALLWFVGEGTDTIMAMVRGDVTTGNADLRLTGTATDVVTYQVACLDNPASVVNDSFTFP